MSRSPLMIAYRRTPLGFISTIGRGRCQRVDDAADPELNPSRRAVACFGPARSSRTPSGPPLSDTLAIDEHAQDDGIAIDVAIGQHFAQDPLALETGARVRFDRSSVGRRDERLDPLDRQRSRQPLTDDL